MKTGIQKRQWLLLFLALSLPLLLNAIAIWMDIGANGVFHFLKGIYIPDNSNLPPASLLEILSNLLFDIVLLGLFSWLAIFASNRLFFQRQWLMVKILEELLVTLFIAKVFEIASGFFMPLAWSPRFHDYLGLPASPFTANWSRWFIFPATTIILLIAMALSGKKNLKLENQQRH